MGEKLTSVTFHGQQKVARADTSHSFLIEAKAEMFNNFGRVAELAYALASGASARKGLRVQLPPRPPRQRFACPL